MNSSLIEKYYPIISYHYSNINKNDIQVFKDGHDHYVFLVENSHAFRFPRTEAHGRHDEVANIFLSEFSKLSPIRIQVMKGYTDEKTKMRYQTYEFIHGTRLSRDLAASLTRDELVGIARDMASFLKALHSFPIQRAKEINMHSLISAQDYGQYFKSFMKKNREVIFPLLTNTEQQWIERLVENYVALTEEHPFEFTVTHSDMLPEHIIIDEKTHKLNGIIDLAGKIADPANDFKFFDRYDSIFLETVYAHYFQVDEYFDKRRIFYAGNLPIANLYQTIERKDEKMISFHLSRLKKYISIHPIS